MQDFLTEWQQPVAVKPPYPYKLARIVHSNYDLKKRWYVLFYAWDINKEKLVRKRLFDNINEQRTVRERLNVAEMIVRVVNAQLTRGCFLGQIADTPVLTKNILKMSFTEAIQFVSDEKKAGGYRKAYFRSFQSLLFNIRDWLKDTGQSDFPIKQLRSSDVIMLFRYLREKTKVVKGNDQKVRAISNKTYNNYRHNLAIAINFLMKQEPKLFKTNPVDVIDSLPVISRKHSAYNDDQIKKIREACLNSVKPAAGNLPQLWLFIQFIYYTLARPKELIHLKVSHIDLQQNRIFIPGEVSKTRFDEYVGISGHFKSAIVESGIMSFPGDYFVFGSEGLPGVTKYATIDPFWLRNNLVLKAIGFYERNSNFTLYSYKHSGAISLYRATKDIKLVQHQCRHKTLNQTSEYLRDLGLISGYEGISSWQGAA